MQTLAKHVQTLELRVIRLEQRLADQNISGEPSPLPTTCTDTSCLSALEGIRQERIKSVMLDFDASKPDPVNDNFFDFVDHAIVFVKKNIRLLQELYNPGFMLEAGKFVIEVVVLLVTTNFVGNPILASIDFIQRTIMLIEATAARTLEPPEPIVPDKPPKPRRIDNFLSKSGSLRLKLRR